MNQLPDLISEKIACYLWEISEVDVELVQSQTESSRQKALHYLIKNYGDIVDAIIEIAEKDPSSVWHQKLYHSTNKLN